MNQHPRELSFLSYGKKWIYLERNTLHRMWAISEYDRLQKTFISISLSRTSWVHPKNQGSTTETAALVWSLTKSELLNTTSPCFTKCFSIYRASCWVGVKGLLRSNFPNYKHKVPTPPHAVALGLSLSASEPAPRVCSERLRRAPGSCKGFWDW